MYRYSIIGFILTFVVSAPVMAETVMTQAEDGVTVYGETYFGDLPESAPLILLFHQGGSNGRGEYGDDIAPWLNENGFRAIAWDQRVGGDLFGQPNRTVESTGGKFTDYCQAYLDLEAALSFAQAEFNPGKVIVWGSSYSGALVFQLAAKNPETISGVIGFSPASGGPMVECRARDFLKDLKAKGFLLRPASEMERASSKEQMQSFINWAIPTAVVGNGVHGSSMLVEERTGHKMTGPRNMVLNWLKTVGNE